MYQNYKEAFDDFCKTQLNPEQQDIVNRKDGVMVIHAGAGSGKTRVITARITSLVLNYGVWPHNILALTFTNKAAREMKERVVQFLGHDRTLPFVGTFHSYCVRLLRIHRERVEIPDFSIIDDDDQQKLLKLLCSKNSLNKRITPRALLGALSRLKNSCTNGTIDFEKIEDPVMRELAFAYEKEKTASKCFDFDDLLLVTLKLLKQDSSIKEEHQEKVRHLLVDEYQDTNLVQHELLKELSLLRDGTFNLDSLCVVGDEDQSIYSWRGAVAGTMIDFKKNFSNTTSCTLEQNYRSVQPILTLANELIKNNSQRKPKELWSSKKGTDRVRLVTCVSGYQEGELVAEFCKNYKARGSSLTNCAILYRSHYQSRILEEAFLRHSIPYIIMGGTQFYDRQEIKDLLAYTKLIVNPYDRVSLLRAINTPTRGLGDKFQEQFIEQWDQNPFMNFKEIGRLLCEGMTGIKRKSLESFIEIFDDLRQEMAAPSIMELIIKRSKYIQYLKESNEAKEANDRHENVQELLSAMQSREEKGVTTLRDFLEEVALLQEHKTTDQHECVRLMTLHAAKGLEFDTVILTGLEEGILPSSHSLYNPEGLEEERRLLYVGITRAEERLLMTHTNYRYTYGQMTDQLPSRFIREIIQVEGITQSDASHWASPQISMYCRQWLDGQAATSTVAKPVKKHTPLPSKHTTSSIWKMRQKVVHQKFGTGTIEDIEEKNPGMVHLTIRFDSGIKKISSQFIQSHGE